MKWNRRFVFLTLTLLTFALLTPAKAQVACSVATLNGGYAFTLSGFLQEHAGQPVGGNLAFAESGVRTFDGDGHFTDSHTSAAVAGTVFHSNNSGTYTVDSDCTGTMTLQSGLTEDFSIADGGKEIQFIVTTPGRVIFGSMKKQ
jgi:hypothetical protein